MESIARRETGDTAGKLTGEPLAAFLDGRNYRNGDGYSDTTGTGAGMERLETEKANTAIWYFSVELTDVNGLRYFAEGSNVRLLEAIDATNRVFVSELPGYGPRSAVICDGNAGDLVAIAKVIRTMDSEATFDHYRAQWENCATPTSEAIHSY